MSGSDEREPPGCRLYLITPPVFEPHAFAEQLSASLDAGDVAALQLRLKGADDATWHRTIDVLRPIAQSRNVAFLLNDQVLLARETGCDGVHVGQDDMAASQARAILGPNLILGVTCKGSRDLAMSAGEDGADYVAFGAFYPSSTKEVTACITPDILEWWSEMMELPCCAIGGITPDNCAPLVRAGASFLAVVGCVWGHSDGPAAGVAAMNQAIKRASESV